MNITAISVTAIIGLSAAGIVFLGLESCARAGARDAELRKACISNGGTVIDATSGDSWKFHCVRGALDKKS